MTFKLVTTFLDIPLKGSQINLNLLNDKARRYWLKNPDEIISRGMQFANQANELLPDNATLRVYYEGDNMPKNMEKVEFLPHPTRKIDAFKKRAQGKFIRKKFEKYDYNKHKNKINFNENYDYEFDASRFCHPPFCLIEAYNTIQERYMISIDADVTIKEKIPEDFFPSLIKAGAYVHYLSRAPHKHMESGFIMWDTKHRIHNEWWEKYKKLYEKDELFEIYDGWTDCHAFDYINNMMGHGHKIASLQAHNVWEVSPLDKYMTHSKGSAIPV